MLRYLYVFMGLVLPILAACDTIKRDQSEDEDLNLATPVGYGRSGQPSFGIFYYTEFREIHVYGNDDLPNVSNVVLVNAESPALSTEAKIEVHLIGTDPANNTPVHLIEQFQLFSQQFQSNPVSSDPSSTFGSIAGGINSPGRLVHEVWFHGGVQNDQFTNDTDVPSKAYGGDGPDQLTGGFSKDELIGGKGNDVLSGREGNDDLYGDWGNDALFGGSGDDYLHVRATGNDADMNILCGGAGSDHLNGTSLADSRLEDGDGDEFPDLLEDGTEYEYTAPPDRVKEGDKVYDSMDDEGAPFSVNVDC